MYRRIRRAGRGRLRRFLTRENHETEHRAV